MEFKITPEADSTKTAILFFIIERDAHTVSLTSKKLIIELRNTNNRDNSLTGSQVCYQNSKEEGRKVVYCCYSSVH